jgi:hypothetical protein
LLFEPFPFCIECLFFHDNAGKVAVKHFMKAVSAFCGRLATKAPQQAATIRVPCYAMTFGAFAWLSFLERRRSRNMYDACNDAPTVPRRRRSVNGSQAKSKSRRVPPATPTLQPLAYILLTFATQKMILPMHPRTT